MNRKKTKARYVVAQAEELPPGGRCIVTVRGGHKIGVFNVGGEYYALLNYCPHRAGPLCMGRQRPLVTSTGAPHIDHQRENEILKCPWHQWEFDIRTGKAISDPKLAVRTYEAKQEDDQVVLYV